jgi:GNAT superfamily N-acetyltransferase
VVHPEVQGLGIGTRLMQSIEEVFPQARRFRLFTGGRSKRNLHIYRKLGYVQYKREPVHANLTLVYLEKTRS